ncbi:MAG: alpha/beta hydrolase [Ardenticatenaceae bacterium]|nr:alpha/beta hydrolase [Ardenticatenaceae bacterium]
MNLEWKLKAMLGLAKISGVKPYHQMTPQQARRLDKRPRNWLTNMVMGKPIPLPHVEDIKIPGRSGEIPARVYRPTADQQHAVLIYFHGGGYVVGDLDSHDNICRKLAHDSGRVVFAIDYRLAPENKFPAATEDCFDALQWVAQVAPQFGGHTNDLALAGDSAGGNLAAVTAQVSRNHNGPRVAKQILIYPATDASRTYPSAETFANAPILTRKDIDWFKNHYLNDQEEKFNPLCSPLLGNLNNLPAALILTAEFDPLRDQGEAYARALSQNGVPTHYNHYPRQVHGFLSFPPLSGQARQAFADIADFLKNDAVVGEERLENREESR